MKLRTCAVLLITLLSALLLLGCSAQSVAGSLDVAEDVVEHHLDVAEKATEQAIAPTATPKDNPPAGNAALTREEVEAIALAHAGFTAEQVSRLYTEPELYDHIPHYDVQFDNGPWEYEYEIHAETGDILSFERDD